MKPEVSMSNVVEDSPSTLEQSESRLTLDSRATTPLASASSGYFPSTPTPYHRIPESPFTPHTPLSAFPSSTLTRYASPSPFFSSPRRAGRCTSCTPIGSSDPLNDLCEKADAIANMMQGEIEREEPHCNRACCDHPFDEDEVDGQAVAALLALDAGNEGQGALIQRREYDFRIRTGVDYTGRSNTPNTPVPNQRPRAQFRFTTPVLSESPHIGGAPRLLLPESPVLGKRRIIPSSGEDHPETRRVKRFSNSHAMSTRSLQRQVHETKDSPLSTPHSEPSSGFTFTFTTPHQGSNGMVGCSSSTA